MINFIKKIFSIFEEHPDKKRKSSKGIVGTQGTSWSQNCKCCFCQPIHLFSDRPPSPSQLKRDLKECKRNYLGNQTVEFVKIANKARNQKKQ